MSSLGKSKGILEIAKFAIFLGAPIGLMFISANNTKYLNKFNGNGLAPSLKEIEEATRETAEEIARKKNQP